MYTEFDKVKTVKAVNVLPSCGGILQALELNIFLDPVFPKILTCLGSTWSIWDNRTCSIEHNTYISTTFQTSQKIQIEF